MIKEKEIEINISYRNITHYKKLGYNAVLHNKLKIKVDDLPLVSHQKVTAVCDVCGDEKIIQYYKYLNNKKRCGYYGCKKCANKKREITSLDKFGKKNAMMTFDIKKLSINNSKTKRDEKTLLLYNKYGITKIINKEIYEFKCDKCDEVFLIDRTLLYNRLKSKTILCTNCNIISRNISGIEIQLLDFIKKNYKGEIIINSRSIIPPLELDIYIPELKIAFEFNGLYWHNELHKENSYHLNKTEECEKQRIQLTHIWEDDWVYKQDIIKSIILNKLNQTPEKIFARKTEIKEMFDNKMVREFLDKNHLQGFVGSKVKLGIFFDNELVSLMTFGKRRVAMGKKSTNEGEYELLRFCNKLNTNVIGGASKLFKYFIENYKPKEITTYADRSHSNGKLYEVLGFEPQGKTQPNYYYIIDGIRRHRFNFRKDVLVKEGFNPNKTEHQIMIDRKIYKIYDSGNLKFILKPFDI